MTSSIFNGPSLLKSVDGCVTLTRDMAGTHLNTEGFHCAALATMTDSHPTHTHEHIHIHTSPHGWHPPLSLSPSLCLAYLYLSEASQYL